MAPELPPRLQEIFDAAIEMEPRRRGAFVAESCGDDHELRAQLESLLEFHDQGEAFLEEPALGLHLGRSRWLAAASPESAEGQRIGPYLLRKLIGSGGMASVYLAECAEGADAEPHELHERVAIKIIRPGMDTDDVIRRFRREREALAGLDHANIARILDGGTTGDGLPYMVMEHIEGERITTHCDRRRLSTAARLDLFRVVCSAVECAHRSRVLHRDLKPGNILVTEAGEPKLLDFGIAKLLQPPSDTTSHGLTTTGHRFFTPDYASPEQIRGMPMTAATDIYSLGVVLYELLTGHRPYRLTMRAPHEVDRLICEQEPPRPSHVIDRVEQIEPRPGEIRVLSPETVSSTRDGHPEKLKRHLSGDVDTIVMKALRKRPEQRYRSVEQLSEAIHHLAPQDGNT